MNNSNAAGSIAIVSPPVDLGAADSVAYPTDGTLVTITDGDGVRRGWITVERNDFEAAGETAWVALTPFEPGPLWTGRVARESITVEQATVPEWWCEQVADLMQALVRAQRASAMLVEDAHRWADDNSLCSVFDSFMREHELPPRRRQYTAPATVTLTLDLSVPVVVRYGEDAQSLLNHDLVEQAVRQRFGGLRRYGLAVGEYTVGELQESVS
jgi:hypothetical protein